MNRLKEKYTNEVLPKMLKELKLENVMEAPRLQKISVNAGIGPFRESREAVESFVEEMTAFTGQKPFPRTARLAIAGFKLRKGDTVGYAVTLRGDKMWAFLDKFINVALPRVRDFRGLNDTSFDENGNYSVGIKEHVIFPEVNPNTTKGMRSLQITMVMSSKDTERNKYLLQELGVPFKKD
jgi:large subunit ribosomal protein L5